MRGIFERGLGPLCVSGLLLVCCGSLQAQEKRTSMQAPSSELGRENLSRVAASASEIKTVLVKDTGLMVELKRWVAQDATKHGQILSEADLSDDAIFDRLQRDRKSVV